MKYTAEVLINLPRKRVVELMDDPDHLKDWQHGLESIEHLSGEQGQPGAKTRMRFKERGRNIEMVETIISRDLPDEMTMRFDTQGVENIMVNRFVAEGPDRTRWIAESEFAFGPLMTVLSWFIGGQFRKQTQSTLDAFKTFAEGHG